MQASPPAPGGTFPLTQLRPAVPEDEDLLVRWLGELDATAATARAAGHDELTLGVGLLLATAPERLLVGWCGGEPVGLVTLSPEPDRPGCLTVGLIVDRAWRGRGLAVLRLRAAAVTARAGGVTALRAVVRCDNEPSRRAFRRAGFCFSPAAGPFSEEAWLDLKGAVLT